MNTMHRDRALELALAPFWLSSTMGWAIGVAAQAAIPHRRRCWCRRPINTPGNTECAEHD